MKTDDPRKLAYPADVPWGVQRLSDLLWLIPTAIAAALATAVAAYADTPGDSASRLAAGLHILLIMVTVETALMSLTAAIFWLLAVPSFLAAWWRRRQGRHRRKAGLCEQCGYDLRASLGRCPECGSPVDEAVRETARVAPINEPHFVESGSVRAEGQHVPTETRE